MTIVSILFALLLSSSGNFPTNAPSGGSITAPVGGSATVDIVSGGGPTG